MNYRLKSRIFLFTTIILNAFSVITSTAQSISGYVQNENNEPIPNVNIYLKNLNVGTSTDIIGKYYLKLQPGEYDLVFSSIGYKIYELNIIVGETPVVKNVWLEPSSTELNQIVVKASKKDPAYEIIQKVIDNRSDAVVKSIKSDVYIKAIEIKEQKEKEKDDKRKKEVVSIHGEPIDPFEAERKEEQAKLNNTNMVEMNLILNYQAPEDYKEERTGYKLYGNSAGLFLPRFSESNFDIYENLIHLKGVTETSVVSPISRTSILSYKYRLEEVLKENGRQVYRIKVIPRKKGNSTVEGILYVNDSLWNINRFELEFEKGALRFYDAFTIKQSYTPAQNDSLQWVTSRQEFIYETKKGRSTTFKGRSLILYSNYQLNYPFPPKFFGNEVAITKKEAYERDSSYWNSTRPEKLTIDEQAVVHYRDSIHNVVNSKSYKDSIEARYNKVSLGDILYNGIGFRSHEKQSNVYFSSLFHTLQFEVIGGWRLGPHLSYFKRLETGHLLWARTNLNIGLKNHDLQGTGSIFFRYLPFQLGDISVRGGRQFYSVNSFDAYLNQLKISNYILHDYIAGYHRIELFNGFYFKVDAEYSARQSVAGYDRTSVINKVIEEDDPLIFEDYEAFITETSLSFTPKQKYMREPTYKRVLGSDFPTFVVTHTKGWPGVLASDIDFDYGEFEIKQDLILGIFGNSKYSLKLGKFFNTSELKYVDFRRFRESDPYLYSDPLNSFQLLDTSLVATNWFFDAHYIHHFNGALINNIPLVKKLRINTVAGAGVLWIKESNHRYEEIFAGIERIFKLGVRRRLRVGIYGVVGESNKSAVTTGWKISFDIIDTWKKEWSY